MLTLDRIYQQMFWAQSVLYHFSKTLLQVLVILSTKSIKLLKFLETKLLN